VKYSPLAFLIWFGSLVHGQTDNREAYVSLIKEGMELQGKGDYATAIARFQAAATLQAKPSTAHYQIAYSYLLLGKNDSTLKYADRVISWHDANEPLAIVLKVLVFRSIEATLPLARTVVNEAVAKFPNDPALWYQYGAVSAAEGDGVEAERGFMNALRFRGGFPDLHFDYGKSQGMQFTAFFPLYYFLLLEANSARSEEAFNTLVNLLKFLRWASAGEVPPTDRIELYVKGSLWFFDELLPSAIQEYEAMTERDPWVETWYTFYVKFFSEMQKAGHLEAFVFMTAQTSKEPAVVQWINDHPAKVDLFVAWLKNSGR
jgi:tetratricopeptide (TPR) repeat protein